MDRLDSNVVPEDLTVSMERFKITFGEHSHTIGMGEPGVLSIIVSAVSRDDETLGPPHECRLELGGLDSNSGTHVDWAKHDLSVGDKIEIEILKDGQFDHPVAERRADPQVEALRRKNYVRKLADEFGWKIDEGV